MLIQDQYGLTEEQIAQLPDETFFELAGRVKYLENRRMKLMAGAIQQALGGILKRG